MSNFLKFPDGFLWGAASASYQVEGGITNNDWALAEKDFKVPPAGDATDHYHLFEQDFDLAKSLSQNCQRISIEWSRIEPKEGEFNQAEIDHYRKVLKALNDRGLKPFVTLWHFTLPDWFAEKGGFKNSESPEIFARYAEFVVSQLDDLCDSFSTMNEPIVWLSAGYWRGKWPPFKKHRLFLLIKVFNNLVQAHNLTYQRIKEKNNNLDINFVKHNINFVADWKPWNKIFKSFATKYWNHLFIQKTIKNIDSVGINYYFSHYFGRKPNFAKNDMGWDLDPQGLYYVLLDLKKYQKPIYVTEAGLADQHDQYRADYIKGLIISVYKVIQEGTDVRGFMYWSLIDNYEWADGFGPRFGLIAIDYKDKNKKRTVRQSAYSYKKICEENGLTVE